MKKWLKLMCMMVVVGLVSTSFALDPVVIGDFEDYGADGWNIAPDPGVTILQQDAIGVTSGTYALKVEVAGGNLNLMTLDVLDKGWIPNLIQPDALLGIDITNRNDDGSFPGWWAQLVVTIDCEGYYSQDYVGMPINWGLTTIRWEYPIAPAAQEALATATYASINFRINSGGARF